MVSEMRAISNPTVICSWVHRHYVALTFDLENGPKAISIMTPDEARHLADRLNRFADVIETLD